MNKMYTMLKESLIGLFIVSFIFLFVTVSVELFVVLAMVILFVGLMVVCYRSYLNEQSESYSE